MITNCVRLVGTSSEAASILAEYAVFSLLKVNSYRRDLMLQDAMMW